jgi:hypothetical protein
MLQFVDPTIKDFRNRASLVKIIHGMTEVLKVLRDTPMLALDERAHIKAADDELSALVNLWIDDVEVEFTVEPADDFMLRQPKMKGLVEKRRERNESERAQKRAASALLDMLRIYHDERKMRQEDYTPRQQDHILVAVQNILDALELFDPKIKYKLGLFGERENGKDREATLLPRPIQ